MTPPVGLEESEFDILLDRYDSGAPTAARKLLDLRASLDDAALRGHVGRALLRRPPSEALQHVVSFLDFVDIVQLLSELYVKSKADAIALAKKILVFNPRFDVELLDWLREKDVGSRSDDIVLIALDILDAVSERDRLVLGVSRFMKHSHPKLRSKAALFIARRRPNLTWIRDLSSEFDARVRANILESLFAVKEDFVISLFRQHVADEDNRTAGNAVLGLYRFGDPSASQLIREMAKDTRPEFRNTSAWVMGQTGDPQFSQTLAGQLSDDDELVRRQALNGLREIKKALKEAGDRNLLLVAILKYESNETGHCLASTICKTTGEAMRGLPREKFFLKAGSNPVQDFQVEEYVCESPINAAFVLCLPDHLDEAVGAELDAAMKRCSNTRRPDGVLTVSKLTQEAQLSFRADNAESAANRLRNALCEIDFSVPNLHLIVIGASPTTVVLETLLDLGVNPAPTIHVLASAPEWQKAEFKDRIESTSGFFRMIDKRNDMAQACFESYIVLQQHYRLSWQTGAGDLQFEIRSDAGAGVAAYRQLAP
jgi:HEAT repeats